MLQKMKAAIGSIDKKQWGIVALVVVIMAGMIAGTVWFVRHQKVDPEPETTTESVTESTTKVTYTVDLEYVEEMLKKQIFTDKYQSLTADSYPASSTESKEAFWAGIQSGNEVNPLSLASTSSDLNALGFDEAPEVKPSELYTEFDDGSATLNNKGEKTLETVRDLIFSDEVKVRTATLENSSKYYNSTPSTEDGIVYSSKVGVSGNKNCWIISTEKAVDVDEAFDDIVESNSKAASSGNSSSKEETTTKAASKTEEVTVIQLCRCGNTVTENPPEETTTKSTTQPTTKSTTQPTTKSTTQPTTKSTTQPTTKSTTQPTTKPTTKPSTTKNKQQDPVNQNNANRGGGSSRSAEDTTATSRYQAEEPTMPSSVRTVTTTKKATESSTTKSSTTTTKQSTTKKEETTTAPAAKPTYVEPGTVVDKRTSETQTVNDKTEVTGAITRPRR